jgi:hypothetical protein
VRVKRLLSLLAIPPSKIGIGVLEDHDPFYLKRFDDLSPEKISNIISISLSNQIKSLLLPWIKNRMISLKKNDMEVSFYFRKRIDVSLIELGLCGVQTFDIKSSLNFPDIRKDKLCYFSGDSLQSHPINIQSLSLQISGELRLDLNYPIFPEKDPSKEYRAKTFSTDQNHVKNPQELQNNLKLAYILMEFFRRLALARDLIAVTNSNIETKKHPIDQQVEDLIYAKKEYEYTLNAVNNLTGSLGKFQMSGIYSKLPFTYLITMSEFNELFTALLYENSHGEIDEISKLIIHCTTSLLGILGEFPVCQNIMQLFESNRINELKNDNKVFNNIYLVMSQLKLIDILNSTLVSTNQSYINEFNQHTNLLKDSLNPKFHLESYLESVDVNNSDPNSYERCSKFIQVLSWTFVYISGIIKYKDFYIKNDFQVP